VDANNVLHAIVADLSVPRVINPHTHNTDEEEGAVWGISKDTRMLEQERGVKIFKVLGRNGDTERYAARSTVCTKKKKEGKAQAWSFKVTRFKT